MKTTLQDIANWVPLAQMESASDKVYLERIQGAMEVDLPHQDLVLIPYIGRPELVEYSSDELIALCPVTFLPDIYKVRIRYVPGKVIPELKSLKYHFLDYAKLPISHEHLASRIYAQFKEQVQPVALHVILDVAVRGGIKTTVSIGAETL
jgi:7-cyano-7-deazaguanine reductase